jgi:hypothetical protein
MAHFAELENNIVQRVIVISDEEEHRGQEFINNELGFEGIWLQCSYNNNIRGLFPAENYIYDADSDSFYPPAPFPSWVLNKSKVPHFWESPLGGVEDDFQRWDEENQQWVANPIGEVKADTPPPEGATPETHDWDDDKKEWIEL